MFLPNYTQNELYTHTILHYNKHKTKSLLHINTPKRVLDRITVNYVRHVLTDYNCNDIDKIEILKLIKNKYTWLEKECNRQIKGVNNDNHIQSRLCNTSRWNC